MSDRRSIPAVDTLLQTRQAAELIAVYGRSLTLDAIRTTLTDLREASGEDTPPIEKTKILESVRRQLESWLAPTLLPVINATGVVLHTNLGRAPLSRAALQAVHTLSAGYATLEYDLENGRRGSRSVHAEALLTRLTGAEAALVVNNNAAAVLLALTALAKNRRVVIARSQLVEIGGGFRIPDVMSQSGARLVEVGTTNKVHPADYEAALQEPVGLVMRAHHSNFKIIGFTSEPTLDELVAVAHRYQVPVIDDLGSGTFLDTARFGLAHEPTILESIRAGADLVCFSGDKLLGGPQAGIVVGRRYLVDKLKKHALARAVRADKLCLAALAATLLHYLKDEAEREIPIWQMIAKTPEQNRINAERWCQAIGRGSLRPGQSTIGGGALPEETLPTTLLAVPHGQPNRLLARLRAASPAIIARVEDDQVVFDPRTVFPEQEGALLVGIQNALGILS